MPQLSTTAAPPQTPEQSCTQSLEASLSQAPQLSTIASPPHSPAQSCTQSLEESLSQVPQLSNTELPNGTPAQSAQEVYSQLPSSILEEASKLHAPESIHPGTAIIHEPSSSVASGL